MSDDGSARCRAAIPAWRRLAAAALVLALTGCGLFSRQPEEPSPGATDGPQITVQVRNLAWKNVHVYVIAGANWRSMGVLSSQGEETYRLPRDLMGARQEIRLAADPVGSRHAFISDPVQVEPGDRVTWTIQDNLALSSVFVE